MTQQHTLISSHYEAKENVQTEKVFTEDRESQKFTENGGGESCKFTEDRGESRKGEIQKFAEDDKERNSRNLDHSGEEFQTNAGGTGESGKDKRKGSPRGESRKFTGDEEGDSGRSSPRERHRGESQEDKSQGPRRTGSRKFTEDTEGDSRKFRRSKGELPQFAKESNTEFGNGEEGEFQRGDASKICSLQCPTSILGLQEKESIPTTLAKEEQEQEEGKRKTEEDITLPNQLSSRSGGKENVYTFENQTSQTQEEMGKSDESCSGGKNEETLGLVGGDDQQKGRKTENDGRAFCTQQDKNGENQESGNVGKIYSHNENDERTSILGASIKSLVEGAELKEQSIEREVTRMYNDFYWRYEYRTPRFDKARIYVEVGPQGTCPELQKGTTQYSVFAAATVRIPPREAKCVPLHISFPFLPEDICGEISTRPGLASVHLVQVIPSKIFPGCKKQIAVTLVNHSNTTYTIMKSCPVANLEFRPTMGSKIITPSAEVIARFEERRVAKSSPLSTQLASGGKKMGGALEKKVWTNEEIHTRALNELREAFHSIEAKKTEKEHQN